jgi:hypothetical protein
MVIVMVIVIVIIVLVVILVVVVLIIIMGIILASDKHRYMQFLEELNYQRRQAHLTRTKDKL